MNLAKWGKLSKYMTHSRRVVRRSHVTTSVDPEHGKVTARLLIALQDAIHRDAIAWSSQVLVLSAPVQLGYPVDGARCGANQIQATGEYADLQRSLLQQFVHCHSMDVRRFRYIRSNIPTNVDDWLHEVRSVDVKSGPTLRSPDDIRRYTQGFRHRAPHQILQ